MMDVLFYMGPGASVNTATIESLFTQTEARKCFRDVKIISAPPAPETAKANGMSEESFAFYRVFEKPDLKVCGSFFLFFLFYFIFHPGLIGQIRCVHVYGSSCLAG